ncbi:MAG: M14 family metallopeptidase [candidate division KSB1 bacterium]|nr:M14 family metallopeptidase [candidate division KSB1 bacterium]
MKALLFRTAVLSFCLATLLSAAVLDGYDSMDELHRRCEALARAHPQLVRVDTLARTPGGRPVLRLRLGRGDDLPAMLLIGGVEGDDLASPQVCLGFTERLLRSDRIAVLESTAVFVIPCLNADAAARAYNATPLQNRCTNDRPIDDDRDGETDEDGYEDLNGDGLITLMRVEGAGEWLEDQECPPLLRRADPAKGEVGNWRLYGEGFDNDRDGRWNEDPPGGVDLNRNFSYRYRYFTEAAGDDPLSEPESRVLADFLIAHPNIFAVFSFSTADNLLHPWQGKAAEKGKPLQQPLPEDAPIFSRVAERFKQSGVLPLWPERQPEPGNPAEWLYYHLGFYSFFAPVWLPPADSSSKAESRQDLERGFFAWYRAQGLTDRFVPWQKIAHPDFPDREVQVGGWVPFARKNPPVDSLKSVTDRYFRFWMELLESRPRLELALKAERMDAGLYRLTATLRNCGYLPTSSAVGDQIRRGPRLKIEIVSERIRLTAGKRFYLLEPLPAGGETEKSWMLTGKAGETVKVKAVIPAAGEATASATLP